MSRSHTYAGRTTIGLFGQGQGMRSARPHIAPAGPACLNNNAPLRRGRTSPLTSAPGTMPHAHPTRMEASEL